MIDYWFQNLNKNNRNMFHFRGGLFRNKKSYDWNFKYEIVSGPELRLKFKIKPYNSASIQIGLLFITAYLTFPFFKFNIDEERSTGFYIYDWSLVWGWMEKEWESSSKDPWYKHFYFRIDEFFLGQVETLKDELLDTSDVYFKLGGKEFKMNEIKWHKNRRFRRFIPYFLWNHTYYSVDMKIDKPPMRSGKGENAWDCGDDGSFGLYAPWKFGIIPSWQNRNQVTEIAVQYYVDRVLKDAKKYGSGSGEYGVRHDAQYEYIGVKRDESNHPSQIAEEK